MLLLPAFFGRQQHHARSFYLCFIAGNTFCMPFMKASTYIYAFAICTLTFEVRVYLGFNFVTFDDHPPPRSSKIEPAD